MQYHRWGVICLIVVAVLLAPQGSVHAQTHPFIWIEGENYTSVSPVNLKVSVSGWGRAAEVLSGGKWLSLDIPADRVDAALPGDSGNAQIEYKLDVATPSDYSVWNRVGMELVRSPFDWRVDTGAWRHVNPADPTVDTTDLVDWNPVGWLNMGTVPLSAGTHTLAIRVPKSVDQKGKRAQLIYESDALCLTADKFHPNGRLKPDQINGETVDDAAAARTVFNISAPPEQQRAVTGLSGEWQITADDELVVAGRLGPIVAQPDFGAYLWRAIAVPGDRNQVRAEMNYVHRYWLRTHIQVPQSAAGRALFIHLPAVNMSATVFVNGQRCGYTRSNFSAWDCDITAAVKPGDVNEIAIGIKDSFYGSADPAWSRHIQYLPFNFWHFGEGMQLDMPVLYHFETGLLRAPSLVVAGTVHTTDVFAKPYVASQRLGLEITVHNSGGTAQTVEVQNQVVPIGGGAVEKSFADSPVTVAAGGTSTLQIAETWPNAKLWWPDSPSQYYVVTRVVLAGKVVDECNTKFGFREWGWAGRTFTLNGVPWHGYEDATDLGSGARFLASYRGHHQTMHRMWGEAGDTEALLDFFDANGVVVRRSGIFDGEGSSGFYTVTNKELWRNWREQLAAWIKSQRNHPSIFIWSIENEITFINGHVFGLDAVTTQEHHKSSDVVQGVDPTRPFMVDGGNGLLDQSLPVYGGHYMDPPLAELPYGAYDLKALSHRQVWPITQAKPILLGETFYAAGTDLADFATIYGESAFAGRAEARPAIGRIADMLSQGYRWSGVNFDLYMSGNASTDEYYNAWSPIAVLCRDWDWTFDSGRSALRRIGIFNDSRVEQAITLETRLHVGGKVIANSKQGYRVPAGGSQKLTLQLAIPRVAARTEGEWSLILRVRGNVVFTDVKPLSVLNPVLPPQAPHPAPAVAQPVAQTIAVFDPAGTLVPFLRSHQVSAQPVQTLQAPPANVRVLLVGSNALTVEQSSSSALAAYAASGHVVIVLDQANPLRFQGLPGSMEAGTDTGYIAFMEDPDHPVLQGLRQPDFLTWGDSGPLYRAAYAKPSAGGKSLVQCGPGLADTALVQMPVGGGMLLLCQLAVGQHLAANPVAQKLLLNLVSFSEAYRAVVRPVMVVSQSSPLLPQALAASGLQFTQTSDLRAALKPGAIAVVDASAANLSALASALPAVNAFTRQGGWLLLNGLTPAGLADFNRLVGYNHTMRPFKQEKVTFPALRNPLTAGLSTANIVMASGKRIFDYASGEYPDSDAYGYVVDLDDAAPFASSPFGSWDKITNNYTMADGFWPLIINFPVPKDGSPFRIPISLAQPETVTKFTWVSDLNYAGVTKISLVFDGGYKQSFTTVPNGEPQTFAISPPRRTLHLTLEVNDWQHLPANQSNGQDLVGIDNITITVHRPEGFAQQVKPMLNIGALVEYPRGAGGIVLCNVKLQATEVVPENSGKKRAILAAILHNLNAPFAGKTIIAGAQNLQYSPVEISSRANQFRSSRGWFGEGKYTFDELPAGIHTFAGVLYSVYDVATSPVPNAIMVGAHTNDRSLPTHVDGIPVNRKADALFLLHAARIEKRRTADDIKKRRQFELARYVVHYSDGSTVSIPVYSEVDVENYVQTGQPTAISGAQVAWSAPYSDGKSVAVAYAMQWNNPNPGKEIATIDLVVGSDMRGGEALLALTAARAR